MTLRNITRILFAIACCIVFRGLPRAQTFNSAEAWPTGQLQPDPARDVESVFGLPSNASAVELLTADGRLLRHMPINTMSTPSIPLGALPDGLYLVRVTGISGSSVQRLVKGG